MRHREWRSRLYQRIIDHITINAPGIELRSEIAIEAEREGTRVSCARLDKLALILKRNCSLFRP